MYHHRNSSALSAIVPHIDRASLINPAGINPDGSVNRGGVHGVKFELDDACNLDCAMCGREKFDTVRQMDVELMEKRCREMLNFGVHDFGVFFGNEPMIGIERTVSMIEWLKNELKVPRVFLTTNGTAATTKNVERCMRAGLDSLKFSVNATSARTYAELARCSENLFHLLLNNIKKAWETRRKVFEETGHACGIFASSINFQGDEAETMRSFLEEHVFPYVDEWYLLPVYQMGGGRVITQLDEIGSTGPVAGNISRIGAARSPLPCWPVFNATHVRWNGDVYACCFPAPAPGQVMGNLNEESFEKIINGPKYRALRLAHMGEDVRGTACEKCIAYLG